MTHDKLLADLTGQEPIYTREILYAALRAVVEMHKPEEFDGRLGKRLGCTYCIDELSGLQELYPCSTIHAIEKELI